MVVLNCILLESESSDVLNLRMTLSFKISPKPLEGLNLKVVIAEL